MQLREETVKANGISLNVASAGSGPVILLLHGFPDTHAVWHKQIDALVGAGYRVVAPDLRGYGGSDAPAGKSNYSLDVLRADIVALLDAMQIERVYLVGHDWGALIGWQLCMHAPERVERFAALSVGHPRAYARAGFGQLLKAWYALVFLIPVLSEKLLLAGNLLILRLYAADASQLSEWRANLLRPGRATAALNYYRANTRLPSSGRRPFLTPVLGIWSEWDPALTERQMRNSANFVQGEFRYVRIEGWVGHWLQLKETDRVNALLIEFGSRALPQV
jgi:pimeloyl-ACP methyl ester carboxylesterase